VTVDDLIKMLQEYNLSMPVFVDDDGLPSGAQFVVDTVDDMPALIIQPQRAAYRTSVRRANRAFRQRTARKGRA